MVFLRYLLIQSFILASFNLGFSEPGAHHRIMKKVRPIFVNIVPTAYSPSEFSKFLATQPPDTLLEPLHVHLKELQYHSREMGDQANITAALLIATSNQMKMGIENRDWISYSQAFRTMAFQCLSCHKKTSIGMQLATDMNQAREKLMVKNPVDDLEFLFLIGNHDKALFEIEKILSHPSKSIEAIVRNRLILKHFETSIALNHKSNKVLNF